MGHGVAQIAAQSGFQVLAVETKQEALDVGMKRCGEVIFPYFVNPLQYLRYPYVQNSRISFKGYRERSEEWKVRF